MYKHPEDEALYDLYRVVSWLDDDGNQVEMVEDRFQSRYVSLETETGNLIVHNLLLRESGVGRLSLTDAVTLGFSTTEYRTITLVEWIEERYIQSEQELDEAREHPPIPWDTLRARYDGCDDDVGSFRSFAG